MKYIILFLLISLNSIAGYIDYSFHNPNKGMGVLTPLVVFVHGKDGDINSFSQVRNLWHKEGFASLSFSLPGQGNSIRKSDFYGAEDQMRVLVFLERFMKINKARLQTENSVIYARGLGGVMAIRIWQDLLSESKLVLESSSLSLELEANAIYGPDSSRLSVWNGWMFAGRKMLLFNELESSFGRSLTSEDLRDRSIVGNLKNEKLEMLLLYPLDDKRFTESFVGATALNLAGDNPESTITWAFADENGIPGIMSSPWHNQLLREFLR